MNHPFFGSGETGMNRSGSLTNHENLPLYEGLPSQGLFRGTAGWEFFFNFLFTDPPRGRPVGAAAIIEPEGQNGNNPRSIAEYYDFMGKCSVRSETLNRGFTPAAVAPPMR